MQKKRQPECFRQWKELLEIIDNCFRLPDADGQEAEEDELLAKLRWLVQLHGTDTDDLIHRYRMERMNKEPLSSDQELGSLSVRAVFIGDSLRIDVLNARHLSPMDSNGSSDPYVKIQLLPARHFAAAAVWKTKVQKRTLFPLFDESFTL